MFVLARNENVFDLTDLPREASPGAGKESEDGPYCICRSGPTGEMVECDKCKEWYVLKDPAELRYHMKCLEDQQEEV